MSTTTTRQPDPHRSSAAVDESQRVRAALMEDAPPPPVRRSSSKLVMVLGGGALLAAMLLVVLLNIDSGRPRTVAADPAIPIVDVVPPKPLTDADMTRTTMASTHEARVELPSGGWVQIADRQGHLAQQYRCERLDPAPPETGPGYMAMHRPETEVYLAGGRVLALRGESALVYAPNNLLESGDVKGDVVIRLFEPPKGRAVADPRRDRPAMIVRTSAARFDSMIGEVVCPNEVHVETNAGEYDGSQLTLQINDRDGVVQHLAIQNTKRIRLAARSMRESGGAADPPAPATIASVPPKPSAPTPATVAAPKSSIAAAPAPSASSAPAARSSAATEPAQSPDAGKPRQFYRLTFSDTIHIQQGPEGAGRTITGDVLQITFSLESQTPGDARVDVQDHGHFVPMTDSSTIVRFSDLGPLPLPGAVAALAVAASPDFGDKIAPAPADDDIIVTGHGRLVMVPLAPDDSALPQPGDSVLELRGEREPVRMRDDTNQSTATCAILRHYSLDERTELVGSSSWAVHMLSPQMSAEGDLFWWRDRAGNAGFTGPGWLEFPKTADAQRRTSLASLVLMSSAMLAPGMTIPGPDDQPSLKISWTQSVDLQFDEKAAKQPGDKPSQIEKSGQIKIATFNGNVEVLSEELFVNADQLAVGFAPDAAGKRVVNTINANGSVLTRSLKETGTMRCKALEVGLRQDERGQTVPKSLKATGEVEAMDAQKTIWADGVTVGFRETKAGDPPTAAPRKSDPKAPTGALASGMGDSAVETFLAEGNVQVVMDDGGRVFADRMTGDNQHRRMELKGKPVLVVYDQLVFERDTEVVITEQEPGLFHLAGPGNAKVYPQSIQPPGKERLERPEVSGKPEMTVSWADSMTYDSRDQATGGSLDFRGQVDAVATPSAQERNFIKGDALTLDFARPDSARSSAAAAPAGDSSPLRSGQRRVRKLMAKGDLAELESRTWVEPDLSDTPRVFNVAGRYVEYDDATGEALVVGDGRLLVRDERPDDAAPDPEAKIKPVPFGRKGTTVFKWTQKLQMKRDLDVLYNIQINGDVSGIHKSMDGTTGTLTCGELLVTVQRQPTTAPAAPAAAGTDSTGPFDLGGSADLRYLQANQGVYFRTPTRDVQCGQLKLDYNQQLAQIIATPGGIVSILDRRTGITQQVEGALWNMATDVVTISRGSGTIAR